MWIQSLKIDGIRNLVDVEVELCCGINLFSGANGAGKTSILEAVHCLATGRSFRPAGRAEYLNRLTRKANLFAVVRNDGLGSRLGLERRPDRWKARLDGENVGSLGELARVLAVMAFHPRLHQLIEGAPEERRRFLDFGVFHVEHAFLAHWRNYRRALRQRNAALRNGSGVGQIVSWDRGLAAAGEGLSAARGDFVALLSTQFDLLQVALSPSLPVVELSLLKGWPTEMNLAEALSAGLERDRIHGHTRQGPHRADLRISSDGLAVSGRLSRGQQKLVALSLTLALLRVLERQVKVKPVFCFDDFSSELDQTHQALVLETVCDLGCQVLLTGTELPKLPAALSMTKKVFHVEQGRVVEVL